MGALNLERQMTNADVATIDAQKDLLTQEFSNGNDAILNRYERDFHIADSKCKQQEKEQLDKLKAQQRLVRKNFHSNYGKQQEALNKELMEAINAEYKTKLEHEEMELNHSIQRELEREKAKEERQKQAELQALHQKKKKKKVLCVD
eukprot:Platyproteum_vivax@DN12229_c0_g1_i1.p1